MINYFLKIKGTLYEKDYFAIFFALFYTNTVCKCGEQSCLDLQVKETVAQFEQEAKGAKDFLEKVSGYLVIPNLYRAGFVIGGGYGEGALIVNNKIVNYYSMISASIGLQAGVSDRSLIIAFITPKALKEFREKNRWKVGVDGSVAFVNWGGGIDLSTMDFKKAIVAFVFNSKGIMASLALDGAVFNKIKK